MLLSGADGAEALHSRLLRRSLALLLGVLLICAILNWAQKPRGTEVDFSVEVTPKQQAFLVTASLKMATAPPDVAMATIVAEQESFDFGYAE